MDVAAEWAEYARKGRAALKDEERAAEEEFAALVERNARRMFRVAYSLLCNSHDAEDTVQEAFRDCCETNREFRVGCQF